MVKDLKTLNFDNDIFKLEKYIIYHKIKFDNDTFSELIKNYGKNTQFSQLKHKFDNLQRVHVENSAFTNILHNLAKKEYIREAKCT